ncbi:MAG: MATE family efflux transporter [archaeon]
MAAKKFLPLGAEHNKAASDKRTERMGTESVTRLLLRFSVPAIIAEETSAGYNLFDAIWAGRLSTEALAALTVASPLMAIYRAVGSGIGVGAASLIARRLGAGEKEEANRAAGCSITFFFVISSIVSVICLLNLRTLLQLFGANDAVLPYAEAYMSVETASVALDFFLLVLVELVRIGGSSSIANSGMIVASIADLIWSPILVFGLGPFPALGLAGAALGTTVGRAMGVAILVAYLGLGKSIYQFRPKHFLIDTKIVTEIYRVGISQTVRASGASIAQILASRTAASFGVIPLAVLGVLMKVNRIVFAFCMGIGQGLLPLVGYNFAAQKKERVSELVTKAGLASALWGVLWWVVASFSAIQVMSVFDTSPDFLIAGPPALLMFSLGFSTLGVQQNLSCFFQGIGKGLPALVVAASRQIIFLIPCLLILPRLYGLNGLWAAYPLSDALALVLSLIWTIVAFRGLGIPFRFHSTSPPRQD